MFIVDDLLLSPVKGVLWVVEKIHDAAQQELAGEREAITAALSELYLKLESGQITEVEFDAQEQVLLDSLDRLDRRQEPARAAAEPQAQPPRRRRRAAGVRRRAASSPALAP
jgi:hypothetical protein